MKATLLGSLLLIFALIGQTLYASPAVAQSEPEELLQNGGFESGEKSPWSEYCGALTITDFPGYVHEGNYAAEFTLKQNKLEGWIYQDIYRDSFVPGETYELTGYYFAEKDPNIKRIFLRICWYDENENPIFWQEDYFEPGVSSTPSEPQNVEDAIKEMFQTEPAPVLAKVIRVIDGDTIEVEIDGVEYTVRYIGVDTPELDDENPEFSSLAQEATDINSKLVEGKEVYLKRDVRDKDCFGRLLRYVIVDDNGDKIFVNAELVRVGYAWPDPHYPDTKYQELFLQLAQEAIEARKGIWAGLPQEEIKQIEEESKFYALGVSDILAPDKAYKARIEAGITREIGIGTDVTQPATVYFDDLSFIGPKPSPEEETPPGQDNGQPGEENSGQDNGQEEEALAQSTSAAPEKALWQRILPPVLGSIGLLCIIIALRHRKRGR